MNGVGVVCIYLFSTVKSNFTHLKTPKEISDKLASTFAEVFKTLQMQQRTTINRLRKDINVHYIEHDL